MPATGTRRSRSGSTCCGSTSAKQERARLVGGDTLATDFAELDARWQAARQYSANTSTAREASHDLTDAARGVGFVWYLIGAVLFLVGRYGRRHEPA